MTKEQTDVARMVGVFKRLRAIIDPDWKLHSEESRLLNIAETNFAAMAKDYLNVDLHSSTTCHERFKEERKVVS